MAWSALLVVDCIGGALKWQAHILLCIVLLCCPVSRDEIWWEVRTQTISVAAQQRVGLPCAVCCMIKHRRYTAAGESPRLLVLLSVRGRQALRSVVRQTLVCGCGRLAE